MYGEPILRAVLWRHLQSAKVLLELRKFFASHTRTTYRIVLRYVPEVASERSLNMTEGSRAYDLGIEIVKTLPPNMRSFGGAEISDEDSRKAKLRDRMALTALYDSPAFDHEIREQRIDKI